MVLFVHCFETGTPNYPNSYVYVYRRDSVELENNGCDLRNEANMTFNRRFVVKDLRNIVTAYKRFMKIKNITKYQFSGMPEFFTVLP